MQNSDLRHFFEDIIALVNNYANVPIEAKRLALFAALQIVEREANETIMLERDFKEAKDAESIPEDKLGELSE